jgi:aminomethyltransferase
MLVTAHNHVRHSAGLFDVSHMLQHRFTGPTSQAFLMSLTPSSLNTLAPYTSTLSVLLNESGGIIDDTIITKQKDENEWYVVTNAGRAAEDIAHLKAKLQEWNAKHNLREVRWRRMEGWGLLALQGPKSVEVLQGMTDVDMAEMSFGKSLNVKIDGVECHVARGGYTGEDGFEVSDRERHGPKLKARSRYRQNRPSGSPS